MNNQVKLSFWKNEPIHKIEITIEQNGKKIKKWIIILLTKPPCRNEGDNLQHVQDGCNS